MDKLSGPTPLETVTFEGRTFRIKRDDLLHPVICGNKWRKLQGWRPAIKDSSEVISFGGAHSNHLPALACVLSEMKRPGRFFIRGEELNAQSSPSLRYCASLGMQLNFITRETYKNLRAEDWSMSLLPDVQVPSDALVIPEGGFGAEVLSGCAHIWAELQQEQIDHFILPSGTGATALGVLNAMPEGASTILHVVSAVKGAKRERERILTAATLRNIRCVFQDDPHGGFGRIPEKIGQITTRFTQQTGIPLNRNYTPKALEYLLRTDLSGTVVLLHTGGFNLSGDFE